MTHDPAVTPAGQAVTHVPAVVGRPILNDYYCPGHANSGCADYENWASTNARKSLQILKWSSDTIMHTGGTPFVGKRHKF